MTSMSSDCDTHQQQIDLAFTGQLPEEQREELMKHVAQCADCSGYYDLVEDLASSRIDEPEEADFLAMRREVIRSIRRGDPARQSWLSWLMPRFATASAAIVAGSILFAAGLLTGRATPTATPAPAQENASAEVVLARQIGSEARSNRVLSDVENSPFRYTDVRIAEESEGRLRLSFDVSRHLDLTLRRDDPLVTEVLVQSVLDPSSVGAQLKAISSAANLVDPRVRGALVKAMLGDPNLGVRLQAQARLAEAGGEAETAKAMLAVLEREESVQMRLVAIDYLARTRIDPDRLRRAVDAGTPLGRDALTLRASSYVQTF